MNHKALCEENRGKLLKKQFIHLNIQVVCMCEKQQEKVIGHKLAVNQGLACQSDL